MSLVTLNTLVSVYKKPDKNGFQKLVKLNVRCKKVFDTNLIMPEHYIKPNGEISKKWCTIKDAESFYTIDHPFEYVQKLIMPMQFKGFQITKENGRSK